MGCYRFSILISQSQQEKLLAVTNNLKDSLGSKPTPLSDEKQIIDHVLKISTLIIAEKL